MSQLDKKCFSFEHSLPQELAHHLVLCTMGAGVSIPALVSGAAGVVVLTQDLLGVEKLMQECSPLSAPCPLVTSPSSLRLC